MGAAGADEAGNGSVPRPVLTQAEAIAREALKRVAATYNELTIHDVENRHSRLWQNR